MNSAPTRKWRTVDIIVAAILAVAFGVVFWAWAFVWNGVEAAFGFYPPLKALIYGLWMMPAVVAALIIRKPGAAVFTETLAATISALLGSFWGIAALWQGIAEGIGGELPFMLGRYRRFGLTTAIIAGASAGLVATVWDCIVYYPTYAFAGYQLPYVLIGVASCAVIGGVGSWSLARAMAGTGALDAFPAGRNRQVV